MATTYRLTTTNYPKWRANKNRAFDHTKVLIKDLADLHHDKVPNGTVINVVRQLYKDGVSVVAFDNDVDMYGKTVVALISGALHTCYIDTQTIDVQQDNDQNEDPFESVV